MPFLRVSRRRRGPSLRTLGARAARGVASALGPLAVVAAVVLGSIWPLAHAHEVRLQCAAHAERACEPGGSDAPQPEPRDEHRHHHDSCGVCQTAGAARDAIVAVAVASLIGPEPAPARLPVDDAAPAHRHGLPAARPRGPPSPVA